MDETKLDNKLACFYTKIKQLVTDYVDYVNMICENSAQGSEGVGISSIEQTTISTDDDGNNVVTITLTDGSTSTFTVQNGSKGSTGEQGPQGERGEPGKDGADGAKGEDGNIVYVQETEPENPKVGDGWVNPSEDSPEGTAGGEAWTLLYDITTEEETQLITQHFFSNPQKKVMCVLETAAASTATNYTPVTLWTNSENPGGAFSSIRFYIHPVPFTAAATSVFIVEPFDSGQSIDVEVTSSRYSFAFAGNGPIVRLQDVPITSKAVWTPIDYTGAPILAQVKGVQIKTYSTFAVGTRLRIYGVSL